MAANRIQIINWRPHGADESYCESQAYTASDESDLEREIAIEAGQTEEQADNPDYDAEEAEDYAHVYYVNDNFTIEDGQEFTAADGTKLRVRIEPI